MTTNEAGGRERVAVYAIIEGPRGGGGRVLRVFASATECLAAFGAYEGRAHFAKIGGGR